MMVEVNTRTRKKNLWLRLIKGDIRSVLRSGRFRDIITIHQNEKLVGISKNLLCTGVFIGAWNCCPLQLIKLETPYPQLCLRFNADNEWNAFAVGPHVKINGREVSEYGYVLDFEDEIQIETYVFQVIPKPLSQNELEEASTELDQLLSNTTEPTSDSKVNSDSKESTDYDLKLLG